MELNKIYNPSEVEDKWYAWWEEHRCFHSEPDEREPYTIVIPPPNVTGILHMGHVLNNTLNDVLIRKARMDGKNACWVPGTDHASIATESKVVARLKDKGISKEDISREEFLKYAWEWKEEHGGIILQQLRKLGASCDWERTRFTMEPQLTEAVIATFCHFYKKGMIYRGVRMVNWDPVALTAISDDEVIHRDTKSHFYHLKYYISDGNGNPTDDYLVIATTRPETIMADAAICVNPNDERHFRLHGKKVLIPLINREIPVIEDDYVEMDFGTGCLKVTPAHDAHDYEIGLRHNLPVMEIIDDHGKLNEKAQILVGEDRFVAREKIVEMLRESGNLVKVEEYVSPVGYSERTNAVIEPKLSAQWFLKMQDLAKSALEAVESGKIKFIPDKYINTYRHWMENARDWCISRQLWWGQRIPAYYLPDGSVVVEETPEKALEAARTINPDIKAEDLRQDEDVLDTWFSSWLWPISVFDPAYPGHPEHTPNKDLAYYYPTNDLVTAPDIIFFWVARMIMAGGEFMGDVPFRNVYFTGIVRDKLGRKMSKSLGNSPDPLDLIARFGADGVRMGMMLSAPAGNDILFDDALCEQGRNFNNKIWNSFRLVQGWAVDKTIEQPAAAKKACEWFDALVKKTGNELQDLFSKYRLSEALMAVYKLYWDEFSAWYLELVKPAYGQPIDAVTYEKTIGYFDTLLKMLHPFMPFITEELWQNITERNAGDSIMFATLPNYETPTAEEEQLISMFEAAKNVIANIRTIRAQKQMSPKDAVELDAVGCNPLESLCCVIAKAANTSCIKCVNEKEGVCASFIVGTTEYAVPLGDCINVEEELQKLEADLKYQEGFLMSVMKKLSNEKFVNGAPAQVVANEQNKKATAESKIAALKEAIAALKG